MHDWTSELKRRLAGLQLTPAREAEIIEELSQHLDDRYQSLLARGRSEQDARIEALADLRDDDRLAERLQPLRQARAPLPITLGAPRRRLGADLWQDLRYALRMLGKQPSFTAAALITLALGVGANTAIFSVVNALLLQRLPVRDPASLVYVFPGAGAGTAFSYPEYEYLRDHNDVFSESFAWGGLSASLNAEGDTDLVSGAIVTGQFFEMLGLEPAAGRLLTPQDDITPGAHPVAVISYGLWQRRFGGRADIAGHRINLNGQPFSIAGVAPQGFGGPQLGVRRDLYVPMMMQAVMRPPRAGYSGEMNPDLLKVAANHWLYVMGRLKPGVTAALAQTSLMRLAPAIDQAVGRQRPEGSPPAVITTSPVNGDMPGQRAQIVPVATLLMCVVGAVLLIACANVANLLLTRAAARRREIALRLALGASRWRLVRQLLTESVLIAIGGGLAGLLLASGLLAAFRSTPPPPGPWPTDIPMFVDGRVLIFSAALSVITGLVFGLAPALRGSRSGLVLALKDDSFVPDARARRINLKKGLVVAEVALSLALLIGAGLLVRSLHRAQRVELGFDVDQLVSAPLNINLLRYTTDRGREFYTSIVERVERIPGVDSASVARVGALAGLGRVVSLNVGGREGPDDALSSEGGGFRATGLDRANANVVGPKFFRTMGIALSSGRDFDDRDAPKGALVAIISATLAAKQFPGASPIGQRLSINGPRGPWREIVGVVADSVYAYVGEDPAPIVFLPLSQNHETGMTLHVRTAGDPASFIPAIRREIQALEPNLPVPAIQPAIMAVGTSLYPARLVTWLVGGFGLLALGLASIGVYGVLAFSMARRTREFGIRMALGAQTADVFALVIREGMLLVCLGVVVGLGIAALGSRPMAGLLYGISSHDTITFVGGPIVLALVAFLACVIPARRATRVSPTVALRQ